MNKEIVILVDMGRQGRLRLEVRGQIAEVEARWFGVIRCFLQKDLAPHEPGQPRGDHGGGRDPSTSQVETLRVSTCFAQEDRLRKTGSGGQLVSAS
jgi:hypothetical protein